jgi:CheY-like chemotaxis protein
MEIGAPWSYVSCVRVLICDDEPHILLLYRREFELAGAEVVVAADGEECIAVAERESPDLIILDLRMPRRDGLSTLPELRALRPAAHVLVVSANYLPEQFKQCTDLGAEECIDKLEFLMRIPDLVRQYSGAAA